MNMNLPQPFLTKKEYADLKAISDAAPEGRKIVDSILSEGREYCRIDQNKYAARIEALLVGTPLAGGTLTEGILIREGDCYIGRCEVTTDTDYYVEFVSDLGFTTLKIRKSQAKSPW